MMAGNPFTLECKVGGTPELITKWYKDGRELRSDRKYQITFFNNISTLKVFSAERGDRGLYTFEVHNEVGDSSCTSSVDVSGQLYILSLKAVLLFFFCFVFVFLCTGNKQTNHFSYSSSALSYLDRLVPPSFSRKLKETNGVLGSSVLLECKVSGTSPISVAWFQDGNEIVSGEKYEISFLDNICALKLNALDVTDTGPYTCVAANVAGSDECSAFLTVRGQWKDITAPSTEHFFPLSFLSLISHGFFFIVSVFCLVIFISNLLQFSSPTGTLLLTSFSLFTSLCDT